ncbi:MAG TPA: hypothetical protein VN684_01640 [Terriglobales bacterium]|nr:hypothetical protein [Terriglobales bacterium]
MAADTTISEESSGTPTHGLPAYWIGIPALIISPILLGVLHDKFSDLLFANFASGIFTLLVCASPLPAIAGLIFRAQKRKIAASWSAVLVVGYYWCLLLVSSLALLFWMGTSPFLFIIFAISIIPLLLVPLLIVCLKASSSMTKQVGPQWSGRAFGLGFFGTLILGILSGWSLASSRDQSQRMVALDPSIMAPNILAIDKCSIQYAGAHPNLGYPKSLARIGPTGNQCLTEDLAQGVFKGYRIRYTPDPNDATGSISGYQLDASQVSSEDSAASNLSSDESGRIWYRYDSPNGRGAATIYHAPDQIFSRVLSCLWEASADHANWRFSGGEGEKETVVTDRNEYMRRCPAMSYVASPRPGTFTSSGYEFEYTLNSREDGSISGFTLSAVPQSYGTTGLRSYLALATIEEKHRTLNVFATPEDRRATDHDSLALAAEIGMTGQEATFEWTDP